MLSRFEKQRELGVPVAERVYLLLAGLFLGALVLTNVIAGKFFSLRIPFTAIDLQLSCGVIAYPVTFLVTDLISELYGKKRADVVVKVGFAVSVFVLVILLIAQASPVSPISYVPQETFNAVFGIAPGIIFGSMIAYLAAQFIDVRLFEFLRKRTKGKHLWLRNNGSTILSQLVDTSLVVLIALVVYPMLDGSDSTTAITLQAAFTIIIGQYFFKAFIALLDTPFIYIGVRWLKRVIA